MKKIVFFTNVILQWIHSIYLVLQALITIGLVNLVHQKNMQDLYMCICVFIGSMVLYAVNYVFYRICILKGIEIKLLKYNISNTVILLLSVLLLLI